MVLYDKTGRAIQVYEDYLEQQAHDEAKRCKYNDQITVYNRRKTPVSRNPIRIIVDEQLFKTVFCPNFNGELYGSRWEYINTFAQAEPEEITVNVQRETLIRVSTLAEEYFTYNPGEDGLHLPAQYPRRHVFGDDFRDTIDGEQRSYIRSDEIHKYIVPWLEHVEKEFRRLQERRHGDSSPDSQDNNNNNNVRLPSLSIPDGLEQKIHLYNVTLHLGLPRPVTQNLIDALIRHMYQSNLTSCHLNTLEMTIARFHARTVAILDPVLCHFIGTYALRTREDRQEAEDMEDPFANAEIEAENREKGLSDDEREEAGDCQPTHFVYSNNTNADTETEPGIPRGYITYTDLPAHRRAFPHDTFILPPQLAVLGHCIRHWAGLRRNGSTVAAFGGLPLNIGVHKRWVWRGMGGWWWGEGDGEVRRRGYGDRDEDWDGWPRSGDRRVRDKGKGKGKARVTNVVQESGERTVEIWDTNRFRKREWYRCFGPGEIVVEQEEEEEEESVERSGLEEIEVIGLEDEHRSNDEGVEMTGDVSMEFKSPKEENESGISREELSAALEVNSESEQEEDGTDSSYTD